MKPGHRALKHLASMGLASLSLLTFSANAWAHPLMQEDGHGHGADGDPVAIGLSWSVLFMMSMPFVLIGLFGAALWRIRHPQTYDRVSFFLGQRKHWVYLALASIPVAALTLSFISLNAGIRDEDVAIQTLKQYVQAIYPRDYAAAYRLISMADRHVKPEQDYLRENESLTGFSLEAARKLASQIQYKNLRAEVQGDQATIHVTLVGPDTSAPALNEIVFAESAANARLSESQKQALRANLDALIRQGKAPTFESEQEFTLVKESGQWRVFHGWGNGVTVRLIGKVAEGLPWEFGPVQPIIRALPGKTYRAVYRARNLTDTPITGKALHRIEPKDKGQHFHELQCFCLIQETLQPGEEQEMALVFTVDPAIPPDVREFEVSYVFYPVERFPTDAGGMSGGG
jgi:hypothetical protein